MLNAIVIGEKIAALRRERGFSQTQLAERLNLSPQAVSKWERGESLPDLITLDRVVELLGVSLNFFSERAQEETEEDGEEDEEENEDEDDGDTEAGEGGWELSGAVWSGVDFSGVSNLNGKFMGAAVKGCNFSGANLAGVALQGSAFKNCDFREARLAGSVLRGSSFKGCNFAQADLAQAEFAGSSFSDCNFTQRQFNGLLLRGCAWKRTTFAGEIAKANFDACVFKDVVFRDVRFHQAFFRNCKMRGATFENCTADRMTYSLLNQLAADTSGLDMMEE